MQLHHRTLKLAPQMQPPKDKHRTASHAIRITWRHIVHYITFYCGTLTLHYTALCTVNATTLDACLDVKGLNAIVFSCFCTSQVS